MFTLQYRPLSHRYFILSFSMFTILLQPSYLNPSRSLILCISTAPSRSLGLPSDITHFLTNGADRVLLKPLNIEAFGQAMKDVQSKA